MKKFITILSVLLACHTAIMAQQERSLISNINRGIDKDILLATGQEQSKTTPAAVNSNPENDYEFYKRMGRTQRTIGLSLLGVGLASGVVALVEANRKNDNNDYAAQDRADRAAGVLFVVSGVTGIASIPFMILAHASNTKARAVMSTQKTYIPGKGNSYSAGITVSLPLGK